jgi:hypothetical protein
LSPTPLFLLVFIWWCCAPFWTVWVCTTTVWLVISWHVLVSLGQFRLCFESVPVQFHY